MATFLRLVSMVPMTDEQLRTGGGASGRIAVVSRWGPPSTRQIANFRMSL